MKNIQTSIKSDFPTSRKLWEEALYLLLEKSNYLLLALYFVDHYLLKLHMDLKLEADFAY